MNFSLKQALKVFLIFACAIGVASASIIITNKNNDNAKSKNDSLWNVVDGSNNSDDNDTSADSKVGDIVSKTESQVGKYADIDGDGTVDGIIFADLMIGGSGKYGIYNYSYNIPKISSSKDYYVSQKDYTNDLGGTADVLTPTGEGNNRFYILALQDFDSKNHTWYQALSSSDNYFGGIVTKSFGDGRENTNIMIKKWNKEEFGKQNDYLPFTDIFGEIQTQAQSGWFIPSSDEWAAAADNLNINSSNYLTKGFKENSSYGTSSLEDYPNDVTIWYIQFNGNQKISSGWGTFKYRLATTF